MGFMNVLGSSVKNGISGGLEGGISGAISGAASSMIGGLFGKTPSQKELLDQQMKYQNYVMSMQAHYNKEQAAYNQELAKEMMEWQSKNQVRLMKEGGLNPALLYGKSGAGASTSGAGVASGVGLPAAQDIGMALTLKNMKAQLALTEAQAAKTNAEAAKIAGPDTDSTIS